MSTLSFHFHGYQPGDIVRWREPDPLRPQTFEERRSPVGLRIGPERIEGTNWTDAVLRTYGRMGSVLQRSSGSASVDIEPQTLAWLLERDPSAYRAIMSAYDQGIAGFVMTPPLHPILPHLHRQEREALFDMMIDFYSPLIQRSRGRPIGLWLPEAAYSRETMDSFRESARRAGVEREAIADSIQTPYLIVDARQFARPPQPGQAWARVESTERLMAVGRDHPLSGEFAFGATTAPEFAASVRSRGSGSLLVANDLESLLANPMQAERFEAIVHTLREGAVQVIPPVPPGDAPPLALVDYSSWSDYDDMLSGGITSDTRWTGLRRPDALRQLAVSYGRHWFREHYRTQGISTSETDFARSVEDIVGGKLDVEVAGFLARGYVLMLMGTRSDPRFWDNPDTRVAFQNVVLLVQALKDLAEASIRTKDLDRAAALGRLVQATFLGFSEWHERGEFAALQTAPAWETTEAARYSSLESEEPQRSPTDLMKRAAMFALAPEVDWPGGDPVLPVEEAVADTGYIVGEAHGEWKNPDWCEHRSG